MISKELVRLQRFKIVFICLAVMLIPSIYADSIPVNGFMDEVLKKLTSNNSTYTDVFVPAAKALYAALVTIEIAFDTGIRMLKDGGAMKVIGVLIVRICMMLLWFAILDNPDWIQAVVDQALDLTSKVGGASSQITPSLIAGLGVQYFDAFMAKINAADFSLVHMNNIIFSLVAIFVGLSIVVLFTLIGIMFFIAKVETTMVLSIAVILIGFLGSSWTSQWGKSYIAHVVAVSLKLSVMMIMVGLIPDLTITWHDKIVNAGEDFGTLLNIAVYIALCSLVLFFMVMSIPGLLASMITGVSTVSITGGFASGGTAEVAGSTLAAGVTSFTNGAKNSINNINNSGGGYPPSGSLGNSNNEQMAPTTSSPPSPDANSGQNNNISQVSDTTSMRYNQPNSSAHTSVPPPSIK